MLTFYRTLGLVCVRTVKYLLWEEPACYSDTLGQSFTTPSHPPPQSHHITHIITSHRHLSSLILVESFDLDFVLDNLDSERCGVIR